jgi:hypothetical protein
MEDKADSVTNDTVSFHSGCAVSVRSAVILKPLCLIEGFSTLCHKRVFRGFAVTYCLQLSQSETGGYGSNLQAVACQLHIHIWGNAGQSELQKGKKMCR